MSTHDQAHADVVYLHALRALSADDAAAAEAQIAACAECRREAEMLRPLLGAFVGWPTNVLRPSVALWDRVSQRVAADAGTTPLPEPRTRPAIEDWKDVAPGISVKILARDTANDRVSMLVRLAPGAAYPPHRHAGVEELHLLDGELWIDERKLYPGDYNRAEPGTGDKRVWSETGCTCVLITSPSDVLR